MIIFLISNVPSQWLLIYESKENKNFDVNFKCDANAPADAKVIIIALPTFIQASLK